MADERIVAIGLLTREDIDTLGSSFTRRIALPEDDGTFDDLLEQLRHIEATPWGDVMLTRR